MSSVKIFDRALNTLQVNRKRRLEGKLNCIPSPLKRLEEVLPGVERKQYYIVTASSGVGKSKFTKFFFVMNSYDHYLRNPDLKLKMFYFCLEESKENFIHSLMSYKMFVDHGITISVKQLKSITSNPYLSAEQLAIVERMKEYFHRFEEVVEVIDDIRHPYGIYKHVQDYAEQHGRWIYKMEMRNGVETKVKDFYLADHPDEYVMVITDHISLLSPEKGSTKHETMGKFSTEYCIKMRDSYQYIVVNVQQQAADKERQEFTYKGQSIESKLEPSLDGLGDNKMTQRDADVVLGLFAPDRYEIKLHRGYNILRLQDAYRSLIILKNRDGHPNARVGMYFNGAASYFEELPKATDMNDIHYKKYEPK